jgi:hypothetical protein
MRKGVVIGIAVGVALVALLGWAGWRILNKRIDPNSDMGKTYAESFKKSFVENCATQIEAHGTGDQDWHRKVGALCQCGADASYEELKNVSVPEQYAQLQTPEMKQKLGDILKVCAQKVGLQLGSGSQ